MPSKIAGVFLFASLVLILEGCASAPEAREPAETAVALSEPETVTAPPGRTPLPLPQGDSSDDSGPRIVLKKASGGELASSPVPAVQSEPLTLPEKPSPQEVSAPVSTSEPSNMKPLQGPAPEVALRYLRNGNVRFTKAQLRRDGQSLKDIRRVATQPKPHALIISPSDSRIPPEIIFDQKLGEIEVIRSPGLLLSPELRNGLESSLLRHGIRLIVVMGLNEKSGMNGASAPADEPWTRVRNTARDLFDRSPVLKEALQSGQVRVVGAIYNLETGAVDFK